MTFQNPLIESWQRGEATAGVWCSIASSFSAETAASIGYDYACVDLQHGAIGYSDMVPMLQAISSQGVVPLVRVSWPEPWLVMQALDAGALGVVVPLVESAEQAALAVSAFSYPPSGTRSFGPTRASVSHGTDDPADLSRVACILMIETAQALANLDEIAATPGIDALYVGPSDLAMALGLPPRPTKFLPDHEREIERIRETCERHGVIAGIHCSSGAIARHRLEQGFMMVTVGSDIGFLTASLRSALAEARSAGGLAAAGA